MKKLKSFFLILSMTSAITAGAVGITAAIAGPASASTNYCQSSTGNYYTACVDMSSSGPYNYTFTATGYGNGGLCPVHPVHVELTSTGGLVDNSATYSYWCGSPTITTPSFGPTSDIGTWCSTLWTGTSSVGYTELAQRCVTF